MGGNSDPGAEAAGELGLCKGRGGLGREQCRWSNGVSKTSRTRSGQQVTWVVEGEEDIGFRGPRALHWSHRHWGAADGV